MATFIEDLWNSIFTPGATPTLIVATNASFGALQFLLLILLLATHSLHFLILSALSAGLWAAINWFVRELQAETAKAATKRHQEGEERSAEAESDTETELDNHPPLPKAADTSPATTASVHSQADSSLSGDNLRRRRSLGDSSGYVSTDSEWEKVSEGGSKG